VDDVLALFNHTVEVFAYNHVHRKRTWEPMIFAGLGPVDTDGTIRVKFVPRRYSESFPGDFVGYWTVKQILRWVREREEEIG
jgi:hypothetical protein